MAGIYVHIPFCKSKCSYCDFCSYHNKLNLSEAYMACVYKEMEYRAKELKDRTFDTIYFGGGTPSIIDPKYIKGALNQIKRQFSLSENPEITIEINPGTITKEKVKIYKESGINRFSVGLQSANDKILEDLNRIHNKQDFIDCCELLKGENFSCDIMLGLKNQTLQDVYDTIDLAVSCGAKHISMYALTVEDGTPIYTDYLNGELPDGDTVADFYAKGVEYLKKFGFERYEVSNFCKKGFESKHNLNYWKRGEYIGFGCSACSFIKGKRFTNTQNLDDFIKCILSGFYATVDVEDIKPETAKFEYIMLGLRTVYGVSIKKYNGEYGGNFETDFKSQLEKYKDCFVFDGDTVKLKDEYLYVQNFIISDFIND